MKNPPVSLELEKKASLGDEAVLTALLETHDAALRKKFRGKIPQRFASLLSLDDLMQETYTDVFLDIADFTPRGEGAFAKWLATIAEHNLINTINSLERDKRGGKRRRVDAGVQDDSFVALYELLGYTTTTPSRHAARREAGEVLTKALERLPEDYGRAVRMYDIEGCSVADVAVELKRSPGAVFMLRSRAHRALRKLLGSPLQFFSDNA